MISQDSLTEKYLFNGSPQESLVDLGKTVTSYLCDTLLQEKFPINTYNILPWPKVGGDPEFFMLNNGEFRPMFDILGEPPDSKTNFSEFIQAPVQLSNRFSNGLGCAIDNSTLYTNWWHPDGIQAEIGFTPDSCLNITCDRIATAIHNLHCSNKFSLSNQMALKIDQALAEKVPLGCRPSFNAYKGFHSIENKYAIERFCGGHFHFNILGGLRSSNFIKSGWVSNWEDISSHIKLTNLSEGKIQEYFNPIIRVLDMTIGLISLAIAGEADNQRRRINGYGLAGDYRITKHTLEYRTPSNVVYMHPVAWHTMATIGRAAIRVMTNRPSGIIDYFTGIKKQFLDLIKSCEDSANAVEEIINSTDYQAARNFLLDTNKVTGKSYIKDILTILGGLDLTLALSRNVDKIIKLIERGLEETLGLDIRANWQVGKVWETNCTNIDTNITNCTSL